MDHLLQREFDLLPADGVRDVLNRDDLCGDVAGGEGGLQWNGMQCNDGAGLSVKGSGEGMEGGRDAKQRWVVSQVLPKGRGGRGEWDRE